MSSIPPPIAALARRLIALEAARGGSPAAGAGCAARVCDRLRVPLARLAGVVGFRSLLARAVALARADGGSLDGVRVRDDGTLEGFAPDPPGGRPGPGGEAGAAVVAHLLGLLEELIGEPLTTGLVREAWPDAPAGGRP